MKIPFGSNAFLLALQCGRIRRSYIDPSSRVVLVWDGATAAVFREGFLLGEVPTDYVTTPTTDEFNKTMQRIAQQYTLPQNA